MQKVCATCGAVYKTSHATTRFCNVKCAAVWRKVHCLGNGNPRWSGGHLNRVCEACGLKFVAKDPRTKNCPEHRGLKNETNPHWNGGKCATEIGCACCGVPIVTTVAKVRAGRKFCSHACSNITKNRLSKKSGTSLENTIEAWFADKGIQFEKQVPLLGITLADFVVGTTVIQCDGVYWHTLVGRADKDREQDSRLNAAGYTVVRISDSELKDDTLDRIMLRKSIIASLHNQHRVSWQA